MFDKVIFHLAQATVMSFNLIAIYRRSYLYDIKGSVILLASKNEHRVEKVNDFQCKLLPQRAPS